MRYLTQLNNQIENKQIKVVNRRAEITALCVEAKNESATPSLLIAMFTTFIGGFLLERSTHQNSIIGKGARIGAAATLSEVVHSLHFLSSFSAIFAYTQLKKRFIDD